MSDLFTNIGHFLYSVFVGVSLFLADLYNKTFKKGN